MPCMPWDHVGFKCTCFCCTADVVIDGSLTRDGSGRPLTKLVWTQEGSNFILQAAIDQANNQNGGNGSPRLVIPGAQVGNANFASTDHRVNLTATNYLGVSDFTSFTFTKVASGLTPIVSVVGGTRQSFTIAQGLRIATQLVATSVCADSKVSAEWVLTLCGSRSCASAMWVDGGAHELVHFSSGTLWSNKRPQDCFIALAAPWYGFLLNIGAIMQSVCGKHRCCYFVLPNRSPGAGRHLAGLHSPAHCPPVALLVRIWSFPALLRVSRLARRCTSQ